MSMTAQLVPFTGRKPQTNERTRYEVVAFNVKTGQTILVGYAIHHLNKRGMVRFLTERLRSGRTRLELLTQATGSAAWSWCAQSCYLEGAGNWSITWTGRTERECAAVGEQAETIYE